jgi:hypothetical protein
VPSGIGGGVLEMLRPQPGDDELPGAGRAAERLRKRIQPLHIGQKVSINPPISMHIRRHNYRYDGHPAPDRPASGTLRPAGHPQAVQRRQPQAGRVQGSRAKGIATIQAIKALLMDYKHRIRADFRFYSQDLINNLFSHPYTKIEFIEHDLKALRLTATKYLDALVAGGFLAKRKIGRSNYYINLPLYGILTGEALPAE